MAAPLVSPPDFVTLITNVGIFIATAGATVVAIYSAVKKVEEALPDDANNKTKVVGGMIVDHTSMLMWSESNRLVVDAIESHQNTMRDTTDKVTKEIMELRFVMSQVRDKL